MSERSGDHQTVGEPSAQHLLVGLKAEVSNLQRRLRQAGMILGPSPPLQELESSAEVLVQGLHQLQTRLDAGAGKRCGDALALISEGGADRTAMELVLSKEEYSRRLAHSLESELGQLLANAVLELDCCCRVADAEPETWQEGISALRDELHHGLERLRWMAADLRPPTLLKETGLGPSLIRYVEHFAARSETSVEICGLADFSLRLAPAAELAIFRIVQQGLHLASQSAGATQMKVGVLAEEEVITFYVEDNGKGSLDADSESSLGLIDMQERARAVGATLRVLTRPGAGNRVKASLPVIYP